MIPSDFDAIVEKTLANCQATLCDKGKEYSRNGDRLWNFKVAAAMQRCSPERALWGMAMKHIVSLQDIIEYPDRVDEGTFYEKAGDAINYILLLAGLMEERWGKP